MFRIVLQDIDGQRTKNHSAVIPDHREDVLSANV